MNSSTFIELNPNASNLDIFLYEQLANLREMSRWDVKKAGAAVTFVLNDLAFSHSASL